MSEERKQPSDRPDASAKQPEPSNVELPDAPSVLALPVAQLEPAPQVGSDVRIEAISQKKIGKIWTLEGEVALYYKDYVVRADKVTYDEENDEVEAEGHLQLEGGPDDEVITATRGTIHLASQTARFYNVTGTIGLRRAGHKTVYTTANPFIFMGRVVIKAGPDRYQVIDGSMTSCRLPKPDWSLMAHSIRVDKDQARAENTTFRLRGIPVFYLPFVTHPVDTGARQSGLLIPTYGTSSTKGTILGEQIYWAINRSTDLTVGAEYYSKRGWAPNGKFQYRGQGLNFLTVHWNALLDRGLASTHQNQGGLDLTLDGRHDWSEYTRTVAAIEYLSSYVYRQAFTENFTLAVSSQVRSEAFLTHNKNGYNSEIYFDRYQSFESYKQGDEIRILHLPSLSFNSVDRPLGSSPVYWGLQSSVSGLSRSEPNPNCQTSTTSAACLATKGSHISFREVGRIDLHPHLSLPLLFDGWSIRPTVGVRETFYSKSQQPGMSVPTESGETLNRGAFEAGVEIRPPAMMRDYYLPWAHRELRHVIEPEINYRYVSGINDFASTLRFDTTDILTNTHEVEYFLTQRFFTRPTRYKPCKDKDDGEAACETGPKEWLSWQIGQKYFFDTDFGGALVPGTRNVLSTTLDFSGVSFLVNPRDISPVISRLRVQATNSVHAEWDLDYDTRAGRIGASNVFTDYRHGNFFTGVTYANLAAPEETGSKASIIRYNQFRPFMGWGNANRQGVSIAANAGYDFVQDAVQYGGMQVAYNWNCCGFNVEYRRFALGSTRNENQYRFNFTLAGVGTAGNLRRSERLF